VIVSQCDIDVQSTVALLPNRPNAREESFAPTNLARQEFRTLIKVMTYNIRHGLGHDGSVDLERTAEVIRRQYPDIVAIQEIDRFWSRSGGVDQPKELSRLLGMEGEFAPNLVGPAEVPGQVDSQYGVMLLTRFPIVRSRHARFPTVHGWEQRGYLELRIHPARTGPIRVITTHLEVGHARNTEESVRQRTEQASILASRVESEPIPAIVLGDFNARPGDPELSPLIRGESRLQDIWVTAHPEAPGHTIPAMPGVSPGRRIDYILASHDFQVASAEVIDNELARRTSDHFPVIANLEI
jgi:endonuclease/exonuclease/phosphatase family metal-dependent hydrolase